MLGLAKRLFGRGLCRIRGAPQITMTWKITEVCWRSRRGNLISLEVSTEARLIVDLSGFVEVIDPLDFMGVSNK
jgi:hypothetical protein